MQTTYYKSYRSAPHAGNIIHLSQLRRRQDLAQRDSLARQPEEERWASETDSLFRPVVLTITPEERRRAQQILDEEFEKFRQWDAYRAALPEIAALKEEVLVRLRHDHAYEGLCSAGSEGRG